jgi:predicted mannosyl-3-phosphoglycerate phosphatase (HAD superfamily)
MQKEIMPLVTHNDEELNKLEQKYGFSWFTLITKGINAEIVGKDVEQFLIDLIEKEQTQQQSADLAVLAAERKRWADLIEAVEEFMDIVNQSTGIDGWHMNGAILKWEQIEQIQIMAETLAALREGK